MKYDTLVRISSFIIGFVLALLIIFIITMILAAPMMFLWNWVAVHIGLPAVSWIQMWGISILSGMLFKKVSLVQGFKFASEEFDKVILGKSGGIRK